MTVRELIEDLKKEDPDRLVICASDSEGNDYSPVDDYTTGAYRAESTWSGEFGEEKLTKEDRELGFTDDDLIKDGVPALCLFPTN